MCLETGAESIRFESAVFSLVNGCHQALHVTSDKPWLKLISNRSEKLQSPNQPLPFISLSYTMPPLLRPLLELNRHLQPTTSISLRHLRLQGASQARHASILSGLADNRSAYNKKIRRGRGPASGKGKTSGRGHKGQGQHGKVPFGFQGGQTPQHIVQGTRGEENR